MKKWVITLLIGTILPISVYANSGRVVLEQVLTNGGYIETTLEDGRYYRATNGLKTKLEENLQKNSSVMTLDFRPNSIVYDSPLTVEGITSDIPYNYFSNIESSSEYVYSLLGNGFELVEYSSTSNALYLELTHEERLIRIIVYEDYLKVYDSKGGT